MGTRCFSDATGESVGLSLPAASWDGPLEHPAHQGIHVKRGQPPHFFSIRSKRQTRDSGSNSCPGGSGSTITR